MYDKLRRFLTGKKKKEWKRLSDEREDHKKKTETLEKRLHDESEDRKKKIEKLEKRLNKEGEDHKKNIEKLQKDVEVLMKSVAELKTAVTDKDTVLAAKVQKILDDQNKQQGYAQARREMSGRGGG
jgi:predicted  nucleic acid-binding Zn-ribbon protein